jgi:hypothetical protein
VDERYDATKRGDTEPIPLVPMPVPSWHLLAELEFLQRAIIQLRARYRAAFDEYFRERAALRAARKALELTEERLDMDVRTLDAHIQARQQANDALLATYRRELDRVEQAEREQADVEAVERAVDSFYPGADADQEVDAEGRNRQWSDD